MQVGCAEAGLSQLPPWDLGEGGFHPQDTEAGLASSWFAQNGDFSVEMDICITAVFGSNHETSERQKS